MITTGRVFTVPPRGLRMRLRSGVKMVESGLSERVGGANDAKFGRIAGGGGVDGERLKAECARDEVPTGV